MSEKTKLEEAEELYRKIWESERTYITDVRLMYEAFHSHIRNTENYYIEKCRDLEERLDELLL